MSFFQCQTVKGLTKPIHIDATVPGEVRWAGSVLVIGGTRVGRPSGGHERQRSAAAIRRSLGATRQGWAPSVRGAESPAVGRSDRTDATDGDESRREVRVIRSSPDACEPLEDGLDVRHVPLLEAR